MEPPQTLTDAVALGASFNGWTNAQIVKHLEAFDLTPWGIPRGGRVITVWPNGASASVGGANSTPAERGSISAFLIFISSHAQIVNAFIPVRGLRPGAVRVPIVAQNAQSAQSVCRNTRRMPCVCVWCVVCVTVSGGYAQRMC